MKKNIFSRSFQILILTLLLLAVLVPKQYSHKLMIISVLVWCTILLLPRIFQLSMRIQRGIRKFLSIIRSNLPSSSPYMNDEEIMAMESVKSAVESKGTPNHIPTDNNNNHIMLRHISMRITEKLKSAYPDATWQWCSPPDLRHILDGETIRIITDQMAEFTHADISFDRYTRIHITPLTMGYFGETSEGSTEKTTESEQTPPIVDVAVWYDLIGRDLLTEIITDLNINGHNKLTIKENGDIIIKAHKKDTVRDTLDNFPGKQYWDSLLLLLQENELQGKISGDKIIVSW